MAAWDDLPDLLLGKIFSYLPTTDKLIQVDEPVCVKWAEAVKRPEVWHTFTFSEDEFQFELATAVFGQHTQERDLYFENISKQKIMETIRNVGKYFKVVRLYYRGKQSSQIINCLTENCFSVKNLKIYRIHDFVNVVKNHQHACKQAVYRLIKQNTGLQILDVKDLDTYDSTVTQTCDVLPVGAGHSQCLQQLYFFQSFQINNLGNLMYLVNLRELAIEPKVLSYSLLYHLVGQSLRDLHIVALSKHVEFYKEALQNWQWKQICSQGQHFRVHCHFGVGHEWTEKEIMLKKEMPVRTFKYQKDHLLHYDTLSPLLMCYSSTLEVFIDLSFSMKIYEFAKRDSKYLSINVQILNFVRACRNLKILIVKEVLLSSTILAMLEGNNELEIILMEDQVRYDSENILVRQSDIKPPLSSETVDFIREGHKDESSFLHYVKKVTGKDLNILKKMDFITLMLDQYIDFM